MARLIWIQNNCAYSPSFIRPSIKSDVISIALDGGGVHRIKRSLWIRSAIVIRSLQWADWEKDIRNEWTKMTELRTNKHDRAQIVTLHRKFGKLTIRLRFNVFPLNQIMITLNLLLPLVLATILSASNLDKTRSSFLETVLDSSSSSQNYCKVRPSLFISFSIMHNAKFIAVIADRFNSGCMLWLRDDRASQFQFMEHPLILGRDSFLSLS